MTEGPDRNRRGFAVAVLVLLLVGLLALVQGVLVVARNELETSLVESRLALRALAAEMATDPRVLADTLPLLGPEPVVVASGESEVASWVTEARRLSPEFVLLTGAASHVGLPGEDRTGGVIWALDPTHWVASAGSVVAAGGMAEIGDGTLTSSEYLRPADAVARDACASELEAVGTLGPIRPLPLLPLGAVPGGAAPLPALGLLPGDSVLARTVLRPESPATPQPVVEGRACTDRPLNWGSPGDLRGPCGARFVLVGSRGGLEMRGGEGQGVLAVVGSLTLTRGARFAGLVLVGGDLVLEDSATLSGLARVAGNLQLSGGAAISGSACSAARALRGIPVLRWPTANPRGWRVHPL